MAYRIFPCDAYPSWIQTLFCTWQKDREVNITELINRCRVEAREHCIGVLCRLLRCFGLVAFTQFIQALLVNFSMLCTRQYRCRCVLTLTLPRRSNLCRRLLRLMLANTGSTVAMRWLGRVGAFAATPIKENIIRVRSPSLHRNTLSQIPRLIHIRPARARRVVRQ